MNVYETLDGNEISISCLTQEEQEFVSWVQKFVERTIQEKTRTQLALYFETLCIDNLQEVHALKLEKDSPIYPIISDIHERFAIVAGLRPPDPESMQKVKPKKWTGNRENSQYVFCASIDNDDPEEQLVFGTHIVPIFDDAKGGYKLQAEKFEEMKNRSPINVGAVESPEMNIFMKELVRTYGEEFNAAIHEIQRISYEYGCAHAYESRLNIHEIHGDAKKIPFIQKLEREVGSDIHSITFNAVCWGTYVGTVVTQEGF